MKFFVSIFEIYILLILFNIGRCYIEDCNFAEWKAESLCHDGERKWTRTVSCESHPYDFEQCLTKCKVALSDLEKLETCDGNTEEKKEVPQSFRPRRSSSTNKKCVPVDLIFVMDDSGSVVESNFQTMLSFASDLLNSFTIGPYDTQVGLIVFSTNVRRIFNFKTYSTRSAIQNAIRATSYTGRKTNTASALDEAIRMFTSNSEKRNSALSLAIVLTDGISMNPAATKTSAQNLIDTGAMVFCIGIGTNLDETELRAIASNPDSKFLINANDFTTLHSKITQLTNSLCIDTVVPDFMTCDMEIQDSNGERSPHSVPSNQPTSCSYQTDFYGKYQVDSVTTSITVEAAYTGSTPDAVDDFHYGITHLSIQRVERSIGGYDTPLGTEQIPINNPPQRLVSSDKTIQNSGNLVNGERFCLIFTAKAGGYVTFERKTYTYSDTVATKTRCYFYDSDPPQHCKILGTCTQNPVVVSSSLTKSPDVTISFQGWEDVSPAASPVFASGIQHYELYVHEMVNGVPGKLTMDTTPQTGTLQCTSCSSFTVTLPTGNQPMLYAFVLEVVDVALNARQARSFILYDNVSSIVTHSLHSLVVTSASLATSRRWQTNLGKVCYSWQNLFYNNKFVHYNPLLPVQPVSHGLIPASYDIFPGLFSQGGTKNIHGIVTFTYSVSKENKNIFFNQTINDVTNETICLSVPDMKDGENVVFSITAIDISLNKLTESTNHYIDSTPPIIEDTWLIKNGRSQLFVHNSKDLSKMTVEFEAFDLHSGLFKIEWTFGTLDDGQILGQGALGIRKLNVSVCSLQSKCYCPMKGDCEHYDFIISLNSLIANNTHIGNHYREYYFEIKATNNALLHKINKLEVFVDNSPPEEGKVFDGPPDGKELDYTASEEIWFWWQGFNDHESGIMFYRVEISSACLSQQNQSHINYPVTIFTSDIEESRIKVSVNETGFYVATVTAFNHAYEASIPMCSDGILYDTTPPVISRVKVQNMKMAPAIGCLNGETWFINESVERYRVLPSNECYTYCSNKSDYNMLKINPETSSGNENWRCSEVKDFEKTVFYLPNPKIYLNWTAFDNESDVMDVFVGFGSSLSSRVSPNIMDFTIVPHKQYAHIYHPGLSSNSLFYLFVKVVNKAGKDSVVSIGPNIIDETAPVCDKKPNITVQNTTVFVSWTSDTFQEIEQDEEIGTIHFRLRSYSGFISKFFKWSLPHNPRCQNGLNCIYMDFKDLKSFHNDEIGPYYIEIQAYNYLGSFCSIKSDDIYFPPTAPPQLGKLIDVLPCKVNYTSAHKDIEVSLEKNVYCIALQGFEFLSTHSYEIGLGSIPFQSNVISLHSIYPSKGDVYCENTSAMIMNNKYFVTLKVTNPFNLTSFVWSNGFMLLNETDMVKGVKLNIGESCSHEEALKNHTQFEYSNDSILVRFNVPLNIGEKYTLFLHKVSCLEANVTGHSAGVKCSQNAISLVPYVHFPYLIVHNTSLAINVLSGSLKKCSSSVKVIPSSSHFSLNWEVGGNILPFITNYKVSLLEKCSLQSYCSIGLLEGNFPGNVFNTVVQTSQKLVTGQYLAELQICFGEICTIKINSEEFNVEEPPNDSVNFESSIDALSGSSCYDAKLKLEKRECKAPFPNNYGQFYRWGIYEDGNGVKQLSPLVTISSSEFSGLVLKKDVCLSLPVHIHRQLFSCVESYCASGAFSKVCQQTNVLSNPNSYSKDIVYDLNAYSDEVLEMEKYKFSSNIGNEMKTLMRLEFNFGLRTKVAGFVLNVGRRNVTWNIMKRAEVPRVCANDPDCVSSKTSSGGFVIFSSKIPLDESIIYYLCVNIPSSQSTEYVYDERGKHLCSNGFVLDNKAPAKGYVKVDDLYQGFLRNFTELRSMWHGFKDDTNYELLGYESDISKYSSCLGTSPCSDDVKKCRDVGLKHWNMETDLELTPGLTYYVGIKAFDHVGNSACAHSDPFVFDPSPPNKGSVIVGHISKHHHAISGRTIDVYWNGFSDKESGIKGFQLGIGTTPAVDDVLQFYAVGQNSADVMINDHIIEGHTYFILLKIENHAGLTTVASSLPFMIDNSPPFIGKVLEGFSGNPDLDFTQILNVTCHWNGFEDPQSGIDHFKIGLGTYPFGTDIKSFFNIGLRTDWTWTLSLDQGIKYFTTVEACNSAGVCSQSTSNGIVIDETAPVPGVIFAGKDGSHSRFSSFRTSLEFQIDDFFDVQSGLSHFEICIETLMSSCDIEEKRNIRLESSGTLFNLNLPENVEIFLVLKAINKAGLSTVKASDGIRVDSSPPRLIQSPEILNRNENGFVKDRSFLNLSWKFNDDESQVVKHVVSVKSHHEGHIGIVDILLSGERSLALSLDKKDWLQNGDTYYVAVTACNAAGLCSTAYSQNFTIDSTKPHFGHLLNATWSNLENKLVFNIQNFTDAESSIDTYYIGVGSTYGSSDISKGIIPLPHNGKWNDEHNLTVNIYRNLTLNERIYLSLWASNKAGLNSTLRHFAFYVSRIQSMHEVNLILEKHSCDAEYCNFDCTCSEFGEKCTELVSSTSACSEINITNSPSSLSVSIGWGSEKKYSLSSQCLYADWNTNTTNAKRFEWSFGLEDRSVGFGVFDVHSEQVWRDVNNNDNVVHCLPNNRSLEHGRLYVAYVKAWWSFTDFTIFQSEPVLIDRTPPGIRRGKFIVDSAGDCTTDIDYVLINNITSCWQNVFTDQQIGIMTYKVYIGTYPGGDDITGINNVGMTTTKRWINLKLSRNVKYFATVEAVNYLGATTTFTSDGFSIDDKPPITGVVYTSEHFKDKIWLTNGDSVDASWEGFTDHGSYIVEYQIALQKNNEKNFIFTPVGLKNKHSFQNLELSQNDTFSILVKAKDAAGYSSEIVRSKTLFVDNTDPISIVCEEFLTTLSFKSVLKKKISTNKILFVRGKIYSINVRLEDSPYLVQAKLTIGNMSKNIDFKNTDDQTLHSNYSFISEVDEHLAINIEIFDLNSSEGNISIKIFTCDRTKELHDGGVFTSQISPTDILVSSFIVDSDNGIADMSINVAQTLNGCPTVSARFDKNLGTHSVSVFVAHGTTVFVSVVAENYAGRKKTFHANRIIIDHTAPDLQELGSTYTSEQKGVWETRVNIDWLASEQESDLQSCQCAFGSISGSENLQEWTISSFSDCRSLPLIVPHASYVYPKVRCRNSVGLAREMNFRPVYIVYEAPVSSRSKIHFSVHDVYSKSFNNYQRYNSSIFFNWEEFGNTSSSTAYKFQIKESDAIIRNWTDIGKHTYASVSGLVLKTEKVYTAEVNALNSGNLQSDTINASVLISDVVPVRTGNSCRLENSTNSNKEFLLTWEDVFHVNLDLFPQYIVYIGSAQGYSDVVQGILTSSTNLTLTLRETCQQLHVVLIAKYATGTETTYMEKLDAPCP